jgi:arginyl-tRNA--protein-N-Asp/Glu arginylyltransferase
MTVEPAGYRRSGASTSRVHMCRAVRGVLSVDPANRMYRQARSHLPDAVYPRSL